MGVLSCFQTRSDCRRDMVIKTAYGAIKAVEVPGYVSRGTATLHAYVARCILLRANAVASLTFMAGDEVAPYPTSFYYLCEASLCTHGAFWIEKRTKRVLNPAAMTVEASPDTGITAHTWRVNQFVRRYPPEEIIYGHSWSPNSDVGPGLAPLKVAEVSAATAAAAERFTQAFFDQGALPPLIITPDEGSITDADSEAIRNTWQRLVAGVRNAWRALVLRRKMQVTAIDMPALDKLAMDDVDNITLRRIGAAFGVPVTMLTDAANYATAEEHRISFWRDTVLPDAELIADSLGLTINYDDVEALADDVGAQRKSVTDLYQAGLVDRDEARQMLGLDAARVRVDDETLSILHELDQWRRKSEAKKAVLADFTPRQLPEMWVKAVKSRAAIGLAPFSFSRFVEAKARKQEPQLDRERELLATEVLRLFNNAISLDDLQYDEQAFVTGARALIERVLLDTSVDQATAAMLSSAAFADIESAYDFASRWAREYGFESAGAINETTRNRLSDAFTRARTEGWAREQLVERIAKIFSPARAESIATTELTRAYSQGSEIARQILAEAGVELTHFWRTAVDEMVCPICAPRDGRQQGDGWNDLPPAHTNCRCWTTLEQPKKRGVKQ